MFTAPTWLHGFSRNQIHIPVQEGQAWSGVAQCAEYCQPASRWQHQRKGNVAYKAENQRASESSSTICFSTNYQWTYYQRRRTRKSWLYNTHLHLPSPRCKRKTAISECIIHPTSQRRLNRGTKITHICKITDKSRNHRKSRVLKKRPFHARSGPSFSQLRSGWILSSYLARLDDTKPVTCRDCGLYLFILYLQEFANIPN